MKKYEFKWNKYIKLQKKKEKRNIFVKIIEKKFCPTSFFVVEITNQSSKSIILLPCATLPFFAKSAQKRLYIYI